MVVHPRSRPSVAEPFGYLSIILGKRGLRVEN